MDIHWENLGIYGSVAVRDLWMHRDLGVFPTDYSTQVPAHGVVMLRVATP